MYNDILLFIFLINCGNFTKAAKRLHLTQSTVSRRITQLEEQLQVNLVRRNTRSIELTNDGHILYEQCKGVLGSLESALSLIKPVQNKVSGKLLLSLYAPLCKKMLAPQLYPFLWANPLLELNIRYHDSQLINMLEDGLDLAIVNYKPKQLNQKFRFLFRSKIIFCVTPEFINKYGYPEFSLLNSSCNKYICAVLHQPERSFNPQILAYHEASNQLVECTISKRLVNSDYSQGLSMAESGDIIAAVPEYYIAEQLANGSLIRVFLEYNLGFDNYYLLRNTQPNEAKSNLFIKFLEESLKLNGLID